MQIKGKKMKFETDWKCSQVQKEPKNWLQHFDFPLVSQREILISPFRYVLMKSIWILNSWHPQFYKLNELKQTFVSCYQPEQGLQIMQKAQVL